MLSLFYEQAREKNAYKFLVGKSDRKRPHREKLNLDDTIILGWIVKEQNGNV
jgi:hypothetical protein